MVDLMLAGDEARIRRRGVVCTVYDPCCGSGGMLTITKEHVTAGLRRNGDVLRSPINPEADIHLFGQEVNPETYAITKADLLLKGEGEEAENFRLGSTLSQDGFPAREFDFMLSNPPYGKSWKTDLERMGGKGDMRDPRFVIEHAGDPECSLITRSSDGQLIFLVNMLSKMKHSTPLGSRIAEVQTVHRSSPGMPARARATSDAGSSRMTGWKRSSPCR